MTLKEFLEIWNDPSDRLLVQTSGSTGKPKPMWVEKRRMLSSARITCDFLGLKQGNSALLCLPLDYIAGKMMVVRSIERGLNLITVDPSNHPLSGMEDREIDFAAMVPSQVFCSLQDPQQRRTLSRIRHLIIGGGAISTELQKAISSVDFKGSVWSTYGMTETLSHIALRKLNGPDASDWYTPFDGVEVSLNEDSCLCISAPNVHDGVLSTNDLAEISEGRFRILGRRDNVICSGGVKLQIEDIEDKLRSFLPSPFCITMRKDPKFGETVVLLIEGERIPPEKLQEAFSHLGQYEVPKEVQYVQSVPMTATGKISRAEAETLVRI